MSEENPNEEELQDQTPQDTSEEQEETITKVNY